MPRQRREVIGMKGAGQCPKCGCFTSKVIDSRPIDTGTRRRRVCAECSTRWTTVEVPLGEWQTMKKLKKLFDRTKSP